MNAGAHAVAVIDRREDPHHAVVHGRDAYAVSAPHLIRAIRRDPAVVKVGLASRLTVRRKQTVLAHQPQHAGPGDPDVVQDAQPCPDLSMPLALEGRSRQIGANGRQQVGIGHFRLRATASRDDRHVGRCPRTHGIDRRAREVEHLADPLQSKGLVRTDGDRVAHVDDLRPVKGRRACSSRSLRRISFSMDSSPTRRTASLSRASSGSLVRAFRPASMPASASSRHCSSSAIVTPTSRDTASTGSPRNNRRTTPRLRAVDQRLTSAAPEALPVALRAPSSASGATPFVSVLFTINHSSLEHTFYPKSVSKKTGGAAFVPVVMLIGRSDAFSSRTSTFPAPPEPTAVWLARLPVVWSTVGPFSKLAIALVAPPVQPLNARTIWVGLDVPATEPAVESVPADTVGSVTDRSAGEPDATPLIEHVVLDTVPVKVIVPSAAWAPSDATPNRPPVTKANAGRNDFILLLQCVR